MIKIAKLNFEADTVHLISTTIEKAHVVSVEDRTLVVMHVELLASVVMHVVDRALTAVNVVALAVKNVARSKAITVHKIFVIVSFPAK